MPARWESSQRPLFVRTVWVDGSRHAILSAEDPLVQYPPLGRAPRSDSRAASSDVSSSEASSCDELAHCLIKLQLVLGSTRRKAVKRERPKTCAPNTKCREAAEETRRASVASAAATMFARYKRPFVPDVFRSSSDEEADADEDDDVEADAWTCGGVEALLPELGSNPLSERVLQWLDLAGRTAEEAADPAPMQRPQRAPKRHPAPGRQGPPAAPLEEPLPSVHVRGLRTRRKRPSLADNDHAWRREVARLSTPPPVQTDCPATPSLGATTCKDRGRTQLHIFMPRSQLRGDADNLSDSGTP